MSDTADYQLQPGEHSVTMDTSIIRSNQTITTFSIGKTQYKVTAHHDRLVGTAFYTAYEHCILEGNKQFLRWEQGLPMERSVESSFAYFDKHVRSMLVDKYSAEDSIDGLTLEELVKAPMYNLELVSHGGSVNLLVEEKVTYAPSYMLSFLPLEDLPPSCKDVARIDAAQLRVAPPPTTQSASRRYFVSGKVMLDDGTTKWFKQRWVPVSFARELDVLGRLRTAGIKNVSRMTHIVISGDGVIGFLLDLIPGYDIMSTRAWESPELHKKWKNQVELIVKKMHQHDTVWGDVNPGNVFIHEETLDAYVIDFGGSNNPAFVDDEYCETKKGDMQGIRRLMEDWLPTRKKGVHQSIGAW